MFHRLPSSRTAHTQAATKSTAHAATMTALLLIIGGIGGAVLAAIYIGGFDALINLRSKYMPLVVMGTAVGLALLVAVWGVLRVAALRGQP